MVGCSMKVLGQPPQRIIILHCPIEFLKRLDMHNLFEFRTPHRFFAIVAPVVLMGRQLLLQVVLSNIMITNPTFIGLLAI